MFRSAVTFIALIWFSTASLSQNLYDLPQGSETRWFSFENLSGVKGQGGKSNEGRKGAPARPMKAGETIVLADIKGSGTIRRIWCTLPGRPEFLRGIILRIYWDGETQAAVEAPLDVCATAYWYQTLPSPKLPPLESYEQRVKDLGHRAVK